MSDATLPEGAPIPGAPLSDHEAAAALSRLREPDDKDKKPVADEASPAETESETPDPESPEPAQEAQAETEDAPETVEPPDLPAIAKALGLDAADLVANDDGTVSIKTKVDGQDGTAKLPDLRKSHQLDSSFTHKSMLLAEERKQFETEKQAQTHVIGEKRQELELALNMAARMLHGQFAGIDMEKLRVEDFPQYLAVKDEYDRHLQSLQGLYGTLQKGDQEKLETQKKQFQDWTTTQAKELVNHVPEWKDPVRAKKDLEGIFATAKADYGITDADLAQLYDSRYIRVLKDAAAYRALQAKQPGVMGRVNKAPVLARPGAGAAGQKQPIQQARERFKQTGSERDAAALLGALRKKPK